MSLYNQKNVLHVLVGKYLAPKSSGSVTELSDLTDGQMALLGPGNAVLTSFHATNPMRIVVRVGDSLLYTPEFRKANVSKQATAYVAPVQQVTYIGYNGSTGSIQAINNNTYMMRILMQSTLAQFANKQMLKFGAYGSSASATQQEVAHGILNDLLIQFKNEPHKLIDFSLINSAAVTAGNKLEANATVVNGINTFTATNSGEYGTNVAPVVGDYVRIGSVAGGTALTSSVYKITGLSGTTTKTFTLDRNIIEPSGTYATATADVEIIPAADIANFGIKLQGLAKPWALAKINYEVSTFETYLQDFGTTVITNDTAGKPGTGYGKQIAELEWFAQGNWGKELRKESGMADPTQFAAASSTGAYYQILLTWTNTEYKGQGIVSAAGAPGEILIAFSYDTDASTKTHADTFNGYLA